MITMCRNALAKAFSLAALALAAPAVVSAAPIQDYLALGDSLAFGETDFTQNPSTGDRGYVKSFADFLGAQNGGMRPRVINLGVDGETSNTFFNGGPAGGAVPTPGNPGPQLNKNFDSTLPTQNVQMLADIAYEKALGHNIGTVSVQLGANDLFALVTQPTFFAQTPAQQQAQIIQALGTLQTNLATLLTELKAQVPGANVFLMGYYNPFNVDPNSPIGKIADPAIKGLNAVIAGEAAVFGAKFVDTYSSILGKELSLTNIATNNNVHPNDQGYNAIASQLQAAAVPEPSSLLVMGASLAAGGFALRRRRRLAV